MFVVCAKQVENFVESVWNFTPPLFVCQRLTFTTTLLIVFVLYSGAASTHLRRLDDLQSRIEMLQLWDWFAVC